MMKSTLLSVLLFCAVHSAYSAADIGRHETPAKNNSAFYSADVLANVQRNIENFPWAAQIRDQVVHRASEWAAYTDDALWELMFCPTIKRSWMVWSDGHCPACNSSVPMYNWECKPLQFPWKMRCPHCRELFPKNDFHQYYLSGIDERGFFDPSRADRSLLFNEEHPGADDPLRSFGVDDGDGYVSDEGRWRFVGAYLVYGQWKQVILEAVESLSDAYVLTGEDVYAHKALILLDRIADFYPGFDFAAQGILYEERHTGAGYVTVWHDACEETRLLAMAYDKVYPGLRDNEALVDFLAAKAERLGLENRKQTAADIQRNIENGLLRAPLEQEVKIRSNYPRTEYTLAVLHAVSGWPESKDVVYAILDEILTTGTSVDGLTGEKGLIGYTARGAAAIVDLLTVFSRLDASFLSDMFARHPRIHDMARFHIDVWCCEQYYPLSGNTGYYAARRDRHALLWHKEMSASQPSYRLFWELYALTGDVDLVKLLYRENGYSTEGLPHDVFAPDPASVQSGAAAVIAEHGAALTLPSVNKQEWGLAVLRSQQDPSACLWLDYDSGGRHGHRDMMNLGFFALGLDLMPDNGYPPVQYGGWDSDPVRWYMSTAAHNTVVVNGENTPGGYPPTLGTTDLWVEGEIMQAVRASAPPFGSASRYERSALLIDVPGRAYAVDVFRVSGGTEHIRYLQSHFGTVTTTGLRLESGAAPVDSPFMRNFQNDPAPVPGWQADWAVKDFYELLDEEKDIHFRLTDFTSDASAHICEGWIVAGLYDSSLEIWTPRVLSRRTSESAPLDSTFVALLEPYENQPTIVSARRLALTDKDGIPLKDAHVALEITLDNAHDLIILRDTLDTTTGALHQSDWQINTDAALLLVRMTFDGAIARMAISGGRSASVGQSHVAFTEIVDYFEVRADQEPPSVIHGREDVVADMAIQKDG